jgi:hypothetical protein
MAISVQNIVNTFNGLGATTGNLVSGGSNNIPAGAIDFESVALHELGHSLGLANVNAASESGLSGADQNYTKATDGSNNVFDLDAGVDAVIGSSDDVRGDDANLFWFRMSNNNPFTIASTVDSTTYRRDIGSLPGVHTFAANGDRAVATLLGVPNTEAVMQQGTFTDEAQRTLTADGIATLRYGMAGVDELAGTGDDYTIALTFAGTGSADIVLNFDNHPTSLASSTSNGAFISGTDHVEITTTSIRFSDVFNWFFNDVSNGCSFTIDPTSVAVASDATSSSVAVTADTGCAWTAVSNDAWITVTGGASGTGNGTVNYSVDANPSTSQRIGTVTIAGQTFTVTQMGAGLVFTDDPLVPNVTPLRAIHVMELRARIDALLVGTYPWTDHPIVAETTLVRWLHVSEMRAALVQAYAEHSATHSGYTAGGGVGAPIQAIQISELRQFVKDLEGP